MSRELTRKRSERSSKASLKDVIALRKKQMQEGLLTIPPNVAPDPYELCSRYLEMIRKSTALGTDTGDMISHMNEWDTNHPEKPERLQEIINRIASLCLMTRCEIVPYAQDCTDKDVTLVHTQRLFRALRSASNLKKCEDREKEATKYDAVFFNKYTFGAAIRALTWTSYITKLVLEGKCHNGFAIVRPPGHHARHNAFEGYCFFNNVAITAEKCIKEKLCDRILVVDFDVHHGDGVQEAFYKRSNVLYFSIHRYENGLFWPNLRESNFNYIGEGEGNGFNINVPLNSTALKDTDYLAIVLNILLPVAYEYRPNLIMICAGYDAAMGCPEGEMLVTPSFYSHIVHLLSGIANGRIVMVLEGGYFIPSLSESAASSLKGLLGDPCPLIEAASPVQRSVVQTINNCKGVLYNKWNCFSVVQRFEYVSEHKFNPNKEHLVSVKYFGKVEKGPFMTRNYYPELSQQAVDDFTSFINRYQSNEENFKTYKGTGYGYEPCTLLHVPSPNSHSFENPDRLTKILELMKRAKLTETCVEIKMKPDRDIIEECGKTHDASHINALLSGHLVPVHDLYINKHTCKAALTSVNILLSLVDAVQNEEITNGAALIRPPGHHASINKAQGFCFVNNVAIAAKYAKDTYGITKILIVDFDVHHGNGTQDLFYNTSEVLYISIHRFDNGSYYPAKRSAGLQFVGHGPGEGFNVNIPFSNASMGNSEYLAAFLNIILPIGYAYKPELVLVSAGFDAGINDPLGGYNVTPEMYGQFIYLLKPLAMGRLIVVLEGGYNLHTTGYGMIMCIKALKGQSIPIPPDVFSKPVNEFAAQTIREVLELQQQYWPCLNVMKKVSNKILFSRYEKEFKEEIYDMEKYE